MKTKKRIASKLFAALVVLTLISCCFLGTTFARYTSTGSGSADVSVATWNIAMMTDDTAEPTAITTPVEFAALSPAEEAYTGDSYVAGNARSHETEMTLVGIVKNTGEVAATVSATVSGPTFEDSSSSPITSFGDEGDLDLAGVFTIQLYYNTVKTAPTKDTKNEFNSGVEIAASTGVIYIYAVVTWTSDTDSNYFGTAADLRDTWIGENIEHVIYQITYTAVQSSELPQ